MKLVVDFRGGCSNILAPYSTNLQVAGIAKQSLWLKAEGSGPIDWSETHSSGPIPLCQNETSINQLFKVTLHKSDLAFALMQSISSKLSILSRAIDI